MRRRLYNLFGLPELPDTELVGDDEIELEPVIEEGDPINIPKPVRKTVRKPVKDLKFHDLGAKRWLEWSAAQHGLPQRGLRYIRPDEMHRLPLEPISTRLLQGDICIVDLSSLAHMDSQRSALARQVQDMANYGGLPVFALDDSNRLLLIPGRGTRIDTETHELGGNSILD
ncbi:MAG TPA: hypothetical protein QF716_01910 [Candidatus Thalassarchaeaceae archaeon]|jgi:hypothetical protein|nr:hypothetical protein [Candidatus Thalassarchaeaceae archaeon]HJM67615.1 hypothetical protein [Candidatus Thalassarchaeaceae archaeon]